MTHESKLKRIKCSYKTDNSRFLLECDFTQQYHNYYRTRFQKTKDIIESNCRSKWSDVKYPIINLSNLAEFCSELDDAVVVREDLESESYRKEKEIQEEIVQLEVVQDDIPSKEDADTKQEDDIENLFSNYEDYPLSQKRRRTLSNELINSPELNKGSESLFHSPSEGEFPITSTQVGEPSTTKENHRDRLQSFPFRDELKSIGPITENNKCIIIGTIFKRMKLQPDVVKELTEGNFHVNCENYLGNYTSQNDKLVLEDTEESVSLVGNIDPGQFVTGVVVGLLGRPMKEGSEFFVVDICFAQPTDLTASSRASGFKSLSQGKKSSQAINQHITLRPISPEPNEPVYILAISDLGFNQHMVKKTPHVRALQKLIDFVWGGVSYKDDERCSKVARVLVLGNSISDTRFQSQKKEDEESLRVPITDLAFEIKKSRQVSEYSDSVLAVKHMDNFFAELCKTIYVDVMPGPNDPTTLLMPQQPFHPSMLPKSSLFKTFNSTTNPSHSYYDDRVEILATAGQNIDIISKFSKINDPIEVMKCHLKWGHSAPSAPDNLFSVPYEHHDPFTIDFKPDIYIAGNQREYKTDHYCYNANDIKSDICCKASDFPDITLTSLASQKSISSNICDNKNSSKKTLIVTVPKFSSTFSCVLINLKTLETESVHFDK